MKQPMETEMIPTAGTKRFVDAVTGDKDKPKSLNAEYALFLQNAPRRDPLLLRLLPAFLRVPMKARMAVRQVEHDMVRLWETSPHLLRDIGVMLVRDSELPGHLIPAPVGVLAHVAASAPDQIRAAETEHPSRPFPVQDDRTPQFSFPPGKEKTSPRPVPLV